MIEPARQPTLREEKRTEQDNPRDKCISQLFEEQVERTPDAVALVFAGTTLTYRELHLRASQLARSLRGSGVGPEVLVGLYAERSLELAVALLAVLMAGGAIVPLEPDLPGERLEFILADTQMPWLLTQSWLLHKLPATKTQTICLDHVVPVNPLEAPVAAPSREVKLEDLAYIIYTSGSTGRPKGVLITHEAYVNFCRAAIDFWQIKPGDRVLQFARFSFDVGIDQLLTSLLVGATVVLRGEVMWDVASFTGLIEEQRLSVVHLPAAYWQNWVQTLGENMAGKRIGVLRLLMVGGDVMPMPAVRRWRSLNLREVRLFNRYGPTETTMFCTAYEVPPAPLDGDQSTRIPIGRAVGNRTIHILDPQMNPVPVGATGEIYIGGDTLARGYWNRPDLTAERFIPDPFRKEPGARLYQTGDLGRLLPDGNLDFLGRSDFQLKIRGNRVELEEIEATLCLHPALSQCAVLAKPDATEQIFLTAFLVARDPTGLSVESLRVWLAQKLPDYMIPSRFVRLPALPLNANGKVDRHALQKLEGEELGGGAEYAPPSNALERTLAEIWQAVLHREHIGIRNNFFDLGGHSLLAVQVAAQIGRQLNLEIGMLAVFKNPTIETLAVWLLSKQGEAAGLQEMDSMLSELEALSNEAAADQSRKQEIERVNPDQSHGELPGSVFYCPAAKSAWCGRRRCNLIILINEDFEYDSFERVASQVRELDPAINAVVLRDRADTECGLPACPTLTFSPAVVRHAQAARGRIFCGFPMSKSQEYAAMEKAGICVPKWVLLSEGSAPDLAGFGQYVVQKPDYGGKGAEVRVVRTGRIRWKPITTRVVGTSYTAIIQELIYTGPQPVSYRVNTLFGKVLYSSRFEGSSRLLREGSFEEEHLAKEWGSIVASARGSRVCLNFDEEIIRLGEAAAGAFPEIPLLGFDIIREVPSGKLYVLEANAIGYTWYFHSSQGADFGCSYETQFDGVRKAAYILAEKTQQHAA